MKSVRTCASQRRFRHLNTVLCRALPCLSELNALSRTFFCIYRGHTEVHDESLLIYQSDIAENTQNPTWAPIEHTDGMRQALICDTVFSVLVIESRNQAVIFHSTFDTRYLQHCGAWQVLKDTQFQQPTLLLETTDGSLYRPGGLTPARGEEGDTPIVPGKDATHLCVADLRNQGFRMTRIAYAIREAREDTDTLKGRMAAMMQRRLGLRERQAKCAACRHRIGNLTEKVRKRRQLLSNEQQGLSKLRETFRTQLQQLNEAKEHLKRDWANTQKLDATVDDESQTSCQELSKCIAARRQYLLWGVSQIYPIEERAPKDKSDKTDRQTIARYAANLKDQGARMRVRVCNQCLPILTL